jgi:hypothetical protein
VTQSEPVATAQARFRITGPRRIVGGETSDGLSTADNVDGAGKKRFARKGFPVANPMVCAAFLSSGRLNLLRRGMAALIKHMDTHESDIQYEVGFLHLNPNPFFSSLVLGGDLWVMIVYDCARDFMWADVG